MGFRYDNKYAAPVIGGPINAVNRTGSNWSGLVNVTSTAGCLTVVSATAVDSTDAIFLTPRVLGVESVSIAFGVRSVNPGVGFVIGPVTSGNAMATSYQIAWMVVRLP